MPTPPPAAHSVGYIQLVFGTNNFTTSVVDLGGTQNPGFQWYLWNFFGGHPDPTTIVLNVDGSMTLNGDPTGPSGQLATISALGGGQHVGTTFVNGAYIEGIIRFDSNGSSVNGVPAFWSMSAEHLAQDPDGEQWPGQPQGYVHFCEAEFLEYIQVAGPNSYVGVIHDWYGQNSLTNVISSFTRVVPIGTNFNVYHRYGFLWVPATAKTIGYAKWFFDDVQVGDTVTWTQLTNQTPANFPLFAIIDNRNLTMILGTGTGWPITVQSVYVWQAGTVSVDVGFNAGSEWQLLDRLSEPRPQMPELPWL
jgi:hypothetical protein